MTSERSAAYRSLMTLIEQRLGSVLHPGEAAILRAAADAHLFSAGPRESLAVVRAEVEGVLERLSARGWPPATIARVRADLDAAAGWVPACV